MNRPEQALQKAVAEFLRLAVKRPARWYFCPNGGNLSAAQAGTFKAMGLTKGVPDLHFLWATGALGQFPCAGFIELKAGKGVESPEQIAFGKDVVTLGHSYAVCRSVEDVERTLRSWSFPLHATVLKSGVIQQKVA